MSYVAGHDFLNGEARAKSMKQKFETGSVDDSLDVEKAEQIKRAKERDLSVFRHTGETIFSYVALHHSLPDAEHLRFD